MVGPLIIVAALSVLFPSHLKSGVCNGTIFAVQTPDVVNMNCNKEWSKYWSAAALICTKPLFS